MKILAKDVFYYREKGSKVVRLWHSCESYKNGKRGLTRPEIVIASEDDNTTNYTCPHCGFEYKLEKNLAIVK